MKFSYKEKKDLFFAGIMISLAFAILLGGGLFMKDISKFFSVFIIAFFTAGIGFLLHELMHKYFAQKYGLLNAEFRAFYPMLWLAILFSFFGFILAAPGAVFMKGNLNKEKHGKISLAGPMTNFVLAILFLILILIFGLSGGIFRLFLKFGLTINSLLAAFNLLPFWSFDGAKVFAWSRKIWVISFVISLGVFVVSWFV